MTEEKKEQQPKGPQLGLQRVYTKDTSFESPNTPAIFRDEWKPDVNVELSNNANKLDDKNFEVELTVTVTVKVAEKTAYLAEVKQAGIFTLDGFAEEAIDGVLGSYCPSVIFPFAREAVADSIQKGGFPPFYLQPVDFNALYAQHIQQQTEKNEQGKTKH